MDDKPIQPRLHTVAQSIWRITPDEAFPRRGPVSMARLRTRRHHVDVKLDGARMVLYVARIEDLGMTLRLRNEVIGPLSTPPAK